MWPALQALAAQHGWGAVTAGAGPDDPGAKVLATSAGPRLFLKSDPTAPADYFAREAEGLEALAQAAGPRVPKPFLVGETFIVLEYLAPEAGAAPGDWEAFGRGLARLHAPAFPAFGFPHANYLGRSPQPNPSTADGFEFFGQWRLLFQARRAHAAGRLSAAELRQAERLAARLPELVPAQPASLLHGDLWRGNVVAGPDGAWCLIDPAVHYGWAEADLAMTALFGGFPAAFYAAYAAEAAQLGRPLAPGWRERFPLYNLYHLLNHLNLFGEAYAAEVAAGLARYGR